MVSLEKWYIFYFVVKKWVVKEKTNVAWPLTKSSFWSLKIIQMVPFVTCLPFALYVVFSLILLLMAPHSRTLAWKIPWTEEPGRLQSMVSQGVGHDWEISLHSLHTLSLEKEMGTHSSILAWAIPWTEQPGWPWSMGSQSQTRLKWLNTHALLMRYYYSSFPCEKNVVYID